jgi:phosphopantothenoylcysteine decarboxylase/phosphopantothenate--cysteine ligase
MGGTLDGKKVLLGVTGGIAAFKAVELARELGRRGASVRVVMTDAATRFVGPMTFTALTGTPPVVDLWDPSYAGEVHVELGAWADAIVVAPATAAFLGRLCAGIAEDALGATLLCARGPVLLAPAMHHRMWTHAAVADAVATLRRRGILLVGPVEGLLASGETGMGRMAEPAAIADALVAALAGTVPEVHATTAAPSGEARIDLFGRRVIVTAGPTHEPLDPVRFLGNRSSGKMGFAIAERAAARGAHVVLIAGPVALATPRGVERVNVQTALEMRAAIALHADAGADPPRADAVVMAAAVADFRPRAVATHKIKKLAVTSHAAAGDGRGVAATADESIARAEAEPETLTLELVPNPDILGELGAARAAAGTALPLLVGFALETRDVVAYARDKLNRKRVDLVVANHAGDALGTDDTTVVLVEPTRTIEVPRASKRVVADVILDRVADLLRERG